MTHRDGFPRLSDGVPHGLRCPASPRHALLAGLEPARPCGQQILSLSRLPIPPQGRLKQLLELFDAEARVGHDAAHGVGVDGIAARKC